MSSSVKKKCGEKTTQKGIKELAAYEVYKLHFIMNLLSVLQQLHLELPRMHHCSTLAQHKMCSFPFSPAHKHSHNKMEKDFKDRSS